MEMNSLQLPAARPLNGSRPKRCSGSMEGAQGDAVAPRAGPGLSPAKNLTSRPAAKIYLTVF